MRKKEKRKNLKYKKKNYRKWNFSSLFSKDSRKPSLLDLGLQKSPSLESRRLQKLFRAYEEVRGLPMAQEGKSEELPKEWRSLLVWGLRKHILRCIPGFLCFLLRGSFGRIIHPSSTSQTSFQIFLPLYLIFQHDPCR